MTDQKDYLRLPEVLEACGVESKNGINVGEGLTIYPILTLSELWEGLCRGVEKLIRLPNWLWTSG